MSNLKLVNIALLLRWWWKAYHDPRSLWTVSISRIRKKGRDHSKPKIWNVTVSFFWSQLIKIRGVFTWSTIWCVGDGSTISYWYDTCHEMPRVSNLVATALQPFISLKDAWTRMQELNPHETVPTDFFTFTEAADRIQWKWDKSGVYSVKSIYRVLSEGGRIKCTFRETWTCKIPPSVKIFAYLVLCEKLLTRDTLRRGMNMQLDCVLCDNCPVESILHLLYLCLYAVTVWFEVSRITGITLMTPALTILQIWDKSWQQVRTTGRIPYKQRLARFICVSWMIWKQRNAVVFNKDRLPPTILARRSAKDMQIWLQYC